MVVPGVNSNPVEIASHTKFCRKNLLPVLNRLANQGLGCAWKLNGLTGKLMASKMFSTQHAAFCLSQKPFRH